MVLSKTTQIIILISFLFVVALGVIYLQNIETPPPTTSFPSVTQTRYFSEEFYFDYPSTYIKITDSSPSILRTSFGNTINLESFVDDSLDISQYLDNFDKVSQTGWENSPSVNVLSSKEIVIDKTSGIQRQELFLAAGDNRIRTYLKHGDKIFILSLVHDPEKIIENDIVAYNLILDSFKFTESPSLLSPDITEVGYIKKISLNTTPQFLEFDPIKWIDDPTKPNGFMIENNEPKTKSVDLSPSVSVSLIDYNQNGPFYPKVSLAELSEVVSGTSAKYMYQRPLFELVQVNGIVTQIKLKYTP
jgi:hypothetical protein